MASESGKFWAMFSTGKGRESPNVVKRESRMRNTRSNTTIKSEIKSEEVANVKQEVEESFFEVKSRKRKRIVIKNDEFEQMPMCGVFVRLPLGLKPYATQKLIMVRVLTALKNEVNVLAESPTGSGKTMALLASTCAWLRAYQEERKNSRTQCNLHGEFSNIKNEDSTFSVNLDSTVGEENTTITSSKPEGDFETEWLDDFVPHGKSENSKDVKLEIPNKDETKIPECTCLPRVRIYYGTRTHKQIAQVVKEFGRLPYQGIIKHTILASREQSCINPVARKSADIAQYCKEVNSTDGIGCSFKNAMRNRFEKAGPLRAHLEYNGSVVFDTEEVVQVLATSSPQLCPYFSTTRILTQDADLIFCPFSYLVDPIIRNSSDVHLKNSIVILDEAHNIEDTCRGAASFSFSEKELEDSLISFRLKKNAIDVDIQSQRSGVDGAVELEDTTSDKMEKLKEIRENLVLMEHLMLEIIRWLTIMAGNAKNGKNGRDGVKSCTLGSETLFASLTDVEHGIDLYNPEGTPRYSKIMSALQSLASRNEPDMQYFDAFKPSSVAIICVEKWLYFQGYFGQEKYQSTYRVNVTIEPIQKVMGNANRTMNSRSGAGPRNMKYADDEFSNDSFGAGSSLWLSEGLKPDPDDEWVDTTTGPVGMKQIAPGCKTVISLWCMMPALTFIDAFKDTRSVILASGTLCPMETLRTELGMEFKQQMEGDQVISHERIFAGVLPIGPHGNRIQCTYRNTVDSNSPFYAEVSSIIRYVCQNISAGILCFVPSYRVLDLLRAQMERTSAMRQIEMKKVVLFEPRRSSELAGVMAEFEDAIYKPQKFGPTINGALMFAVFRGKISEGIDFADDRARVVISIGIPFPSATDEMVNAKRAYNDENCKQFGILNGEEWYVTQAYRALNQALGRCLRHRNDWGAMLMIDERLERQVGNSTSGAASAKVSKWIRAQLKSYPSFKQFDANFREFFEKMTLESKGNIKNE